MTNGWTGGQYSVCRALCGLYLLVHFAMLLFRGPESFPAAGVLGDRGATPLLRLIPNVLAIADAPAVVSAMLVVASAAAVLFILGWWDRVAALVMGYVLACLFARHPLMVDPALSFLGWLLLGHPLLPRAPYGSLAARGRTDPRGTWRFPPALFAATWIVMAAAYFFSGYTRLVSPSWAGGAAMARMLDDGLALKIATGAAVGLELAFAPLALVRRARPWLWLAMTLLQCGLLLSTGSADQSLGMLAFHLFAFDPAWIRAWKPGVTDTVFFDGTCGLCHRAVRFMIAEDRAGTAFTYAPLGGERSRAVMPNLATLPDSVVIRTAEGETLTRSTGTLRCMRRLGGIWRVIASVLGVVPRAARDLVYDFIARTRYRVFGRESAACPLLPPELRSRFVP